MLTGIFMLVIGMGIWSCGMFQMYEAFIKPGIFRVSTFLSGIGCCLLGGGLTGYSYGILSELIL